MYLLVFLCVFRVLKQPPKVTKNEFQLGMVLEAVDKKSPRYIGPAVVSEVNREGAAITIQFLGWKDVGSLQCPINSRDIFPVG